MVQVEGPAKHFEWREWKEFHFIKTSWILSSLLKELLTRFDPFSSKRPIFVNKKVLKFDSHFKE